MRNAATFDDDIAYEASARRPKPRKSGKKPRKTSKRFRIDMHRVARYAAIGMSATVGIGIMVNALMLQKGHHPAPLFAQQATPLPEPAPRPTPMAPAAPEASDPAPAATMAIPVPPAKPHHNAAADTAETSLDDDPIGRLLKTSGNPTQTEKSDQIRVLGVQQALVKLHFTVKPNGTLGPATKKAIEAFEKDRHLPVNGEISHRLIKILSAETGIRIDQGVARE